MYMRRKADEYLAGWKRDPSHKPLIVKGARHTGKTTSVLHFAHENYASVIYINFAEERKYLRITDIGYDAAGLVKRITFIDPGKKFIPGETIIVFDEIQEKPDIVMTLKSFREDGRYDVICCGSFWSGYSPRISSTSVGNKTDYELPSLDFEEFLWAKGYSGVQVQDIFLHMTELRPFSRVELKVWNDLFLEYCVLGGMPGVVRQYIDSGTFSGSLEVQRQIRLDYEADIRKYAEGMNQSKITAVYRSVPAQLARENKKFQFNLVARNARSREYTGCIEWLIDAGAVMSCKCLNFPKLPLRGNTDDSRFKLYYPDTGLLISALDDEAQEDLRSNRNLSRFS